MAESDKQKELRALYEQIQSDPSYRTAQMGETFVPGRGDPEGSPVVFIGEAPGRDEEKARKPFVGAAGRNLDTLLHDAGIPQQGIFITNLVKYRPFGSKGENRSPSIKESRYALPYLLTELKILTPKLIVCLGLSSAKALLQRMDLKMGDANGVLFEDHGMNILVTYHPSPYNYKIPEKREALREAFGRLKELLSDHSS
jgi:uracil-DNA glycosylase